MNVTDGQLAEAGESLAAVLEKKGMTIATAESCTGGWVAKVLTDRAGSSAYVVAGLVTYSNAAKEAILGVSADTLEQYGAVSEAVVRQMVAGAIDATGVDIAVAISGVAGPGGEVLTSRLAPSGLHGAPEPATPKPGSNILMVVGIRFAVSQFCMY